VPQRGDRIALLLAGWRQGTRHSMWQHPRFNIRSARSRYADIHDHLAP
jgi:hypothetical protein